MSGHSATTAAARRGDGDLRHRAVDCPEGAGQASPGHHSAGPVVPGLRLPFAIVTKAHATVRVEDRSSRQSATYAFTVGVSKSPCRRAARASTCRPICARRSRCWSGHPRHSARNLRLGPLNLSLRVDLSVFAQLIVKLCAQLRLRLDVDLGRPNVPDLRQCRLVNARNVRGRRFRSPRSRPRGVGRARCRLRPCRADACPAAVPASV